MFGLLVPALLVLVVAGTLLKISRWRQHYKTAQITKFPIFYSPVHLADAWWMILYPLLLPILRQLPSDWIKPWLTIAQTWRIWKTGHQPFEEAGEDSLVLATPNGNILWTCDHSVIYDLLSQHPKVQVPVDLVGFYDVWGPTVGSVEGEEWKAHRRAVTAGFGNSMNTTVWKEAQRQTRTLIDYWRTEENSTVSAMHHYTSRLALHVISCGFFNMKLEWDGDDDHNEKKDQSQKVRLPFDKALPLLLKRLSTVFVTPRALLHRLPFTMFQEASLALNETETYIKKQRADAEANIDEIMKKRNQSILEAIVASGKDSNITNKSPFLEKGVLGNMFFTLLAGHETVGSSLGIILILAALFPDMQQRIQAQLDRQLGTRLMEEWSLERDYPALQRGYIGAVQKELLTIYHPASFLLRRVVETVNVIDSEGMTHTIPAGTLSMINVAAAFKNPRVWKKPTVSAARKQAVNDSPALYFNPDRWLDVNGTLKETFHIKSASREVPDWWAFGMGPRSCPGKAFAQIETTSAMATLFRSYSLELVVDEKTVSECNGDKALAWKKTRDEGIRMLYDDIEANITISLPTALPIRVVRRSTEDNH